MIDELQTALFRRFVKYPQPCRLCRAEACEQPHVVTPKGEFLRLSKKQAPAGSISWDSCPFRSATPYVLGFERSDLAEVLSWAYERGVHRHPGLSAGSAWLIRTWLRLRDLPGQIVEAAAWAKTDKGGK
jgi:hypothetical protein